MDLISRLSTFFGFDHNIFLLDSSANQDRFTLTKHSNDEDIFTPQTVYVLDTNLHNGTSDLEISKIRGKNAFVIIFVTETLNFENVNIQLSVKRDAMVPHSYENFRVFC